MPSLYTNQLFTFKQQIAKSSQDTLPYSIIFSSQLKLIVCCCNLSEKYNSHEKQCCYLLGIKALPWNNMCYRITHTVKPLQKPNQLKRGYSLTCK